MSTRKTTDTVRLASVACGAMLTVGVVAGCGGDDGDVDNDANGGGEYCSQVENMKGEFADVSSTDATLDDMRNAVDLMGEVAGSAPNDISAEWESVHSAADDMVSGLEDLGLPRDEPLGPAAQKLVKDPKKAQKLNQAMSSMQSVQPDAAAIEKNVQQECDVQLGSGSGQ